ncbi:MAG: hypothetical protein QM270_05930 [Bacillota bacterium]|nr:hypothetical protein [Bacillota bacterium]
MAQTLEAAITVPTVVGLTVGLLATGISAYGHFRQSAECDARRLAREAPAVVYYVERTDSGHIAGTFTRPELLLRQGAAIEDLIRLMYRHVKESAGAGCGEAGP